MAVHDDNEYIPSQRTHHCEGLVYHGSRYMTRQRIFSLFGFDSGLSGSDDVDEVAIDGGGMDVDVLLTFFLGGIICMWEEWKLYMSFIHC
jgi:hypothetical protein